MHIARHHIKQTRDHLQNVNSFRNCCMVAMIFQTYVNQKGYMTTELSYLETPDWMTRFLDTWFAVLSLQPVMKPIWVLDASCSQLNSTICSPRVAQCFIKSNLADLQNNSSRAGRKKTLTKSIRKIEKRIVSLDFFNTKQISIVFTYFVYEGMHSYPTRFNSLYAMLNLQSLTSNTWYIWLAAVPLGVFNMRVIRHLVQVCIKCREWKKMPIHVLFIQLVGNCMQYIDEELVHVPTVTLCEVVQKRLKPMKFIQQAFPRLSTFKHTAFQAQSNHPPHSPSWPRKDQNELISSA